MFQFFGVGGAVVYILTQIGIGRNAGNGNASSGGAHDVRIIWGFNGAGRKFFEQDTSVKLHRFKGVLRDNGKLTHYLPPF